jgi:hypothetical protein
MMIMSTTLACEDDLGLMLCMQLVSFLIYRQADGCELRNMGPCQHLSSRVGFIKMSLISCLCLRTM